MDHGSVWSSLQSYGLSLNTLHLAERISISSVDEQQLDNEANTVDKKHVIDILEEASDYERGMARLDNKGKAIVIKLKEWAGSVAHKVIDASRK